MSIQIENRQSAVKIDPRRIRAVLTKLLKRLGRTGSELSIVFVDDAAIREINRSYLGRDRATNVISFPMQEGEHGGVNPRLLGDIVISAQTAEAAAKIGGMTTDDEIDFLLIHGLLHLVGYNHEGTTDAEEKRMREAEAELFRILTGYRLAD